MEKKSPLLIFGNSAVVAISKNGAKLISQEDVSKLSGSEIEAWISGEETEPGCTPAHESGPARQNKKAGKS